MSACMQTQPVKVPSQKDLLRIAIPSTLAAMAVPAAELVDLAFLGHLDDVNQLSGVVLAIVIFDYIFWSFGFLRMGTTGLVAQALGADDRREQANLFWRAVLLALFFGSVLTLLQGPIGRLGFALLSGGEAVERAGLDYYNAHIWAAIPVLTYYACVGWLLGQGRAGMVLVINLIWQLVNIGLNYWFVIELRWGASGAGFALMIAEWVGAFVALYCVHRTWGGVPTFHREDVLHWPKAKALMTLNSAILIRTFLLISVMAAFTNISATYGATVLAANAILLRLWSTTAYIIDGFAIALETLGGRYFGQQNRAALRRSFFLTLQWNGVLTVAFMLIYGFGISAILGLMTDHAEVTAQAQAHLHWLLLTLIVGGFAFVYDGFFLGLAKPGLLMRSMLVSCAVFAPVAALSAYLNSVDILWVAMFLFLAARAVTLSLPARHYLRIPPRATEKQ